MADSINVITGHAALPGGKADTLSETGCKSQNPLPSLHEIVTPREPVDTC